MQTLSTSAAYTRYAFAQLQRTVSIRCSLNAWLACVLWQVVKVNVSAARVARASEQQLGALGGRRCWVNERSLQQKHEANIEGRGKSTIA